MLGHLCLINDNFNSEMNNNQNKIKTIFIILLLKVFHERLSNKQAPAQQKNVCSNSTIETLSGVFIVKFEYKVFLLLTFEQIIACWVWN